MGRLTEQSTLIYRQAIADRNAAASLTDQARVAETERQALSDEAEAAAAAAEAASAAARQELAQQYAAADQLYDQLASLKGTTAEVERQYIAGLTNPGGPTNPGSPDPAPTTPPTTPAPDPGPGTPPPPPPPPPPTTSAAQGAINFAYAQLGDPYVYGGAGPNGWDCSGLTKAAYASVGVYIGIHGASSQYNYMAGQGRLVSVSSLIPGDLVFYSTGGSTSGTKYHTAIYIGNGQMIEAPYEPLSVQVTTLRYRDLVPYAARPTG
jgi:cell wall-associated NlpC family hydrolase